MDSLIAARFQVPPGAEAHYRERVLRMPDGYVCFDPPASAPEVGPLPATRRGHVTFGCFNNIAKVTDEVVARWAEIVRRGRRAPLPPLLPRRNGGRGGGRGGAPCPPGRA